jgi:uncharacterized protein (DUF885 family)
MTSDAHPQSPSQRTRTALDALADEHVERSIAADPFLATELGVPGHEGEVTDFSPAAIAARTDQARRTLERIESTPDEDAVDAVTRAAMRERLGLEIELAEQHLDVATVNNLASTLQIRDVFDQMATGTAEDWEVIAERLAKIPDSLEGWAQSLREAAAAGVVSARRQLDLGAAQARGYAEDFFPAFAREAKGDDAQREHVVAAAQEAARGYRGIAEVLESLREQAPKADAVGRDHYRLASRAFLGEEVDLEETYAWGIDQLHEIIAEQEQVAGRLNAHYGNGGGSSIEAARASLDADPARILHGTEALRAWMQEKSDTALRELTGTHFDIPEQLQRLECMIARTGSGGIYYTGPSEDFTRPGRMWWDVPPENTELRTWTETTTVYHEGVPGHHLQVGTQTLQAATLNRWRALMCWVSGHGEGWALYAEKLMDSLGYLEDDGDRLGMLDSQRMRAGRVVLDIGLHLQLPMPTGLPGADGGAWTFDAAWDFMAPNWGASEAERRFELNRYTGWPGQAPSYAVGRRTWEQLRAQHVPAGGDPRDFHRRALELGSLPLSVLKEALA